MIARLLRMQDKDIEQRLTASVAAPRLAQASLTPPRAASLFTPSRPTYGHKQVSSYAGK